MFWKNIIFIFIFSLFFGFRVVANGLPDADRDGVPDQDERQIYYTDPNKADTDDDGFNDFEEINSGFSPHNPQAVKTIDSDVDSDTLSEAWEIKFKTDPRNKDSDNDGVYDGVEIDKGFNPLSVENSRLKPSLRINLQKQTLDYLLFGYVWKSFSVSTGKASMPTPTGDFMVVNKIEKAWSRTYRLWMPYWLGINSPGIGIHELPIWPNGYREGENHLGRPVSHGCVRLGIGAAAYIYDRVSSGTPISIR
jgi:hypothetical protein